MRRYVTLKVTLKFHRIQKFNNIQGILFKIKVHVNFWYNQRSWRVSRYFSCVCPTDCVMLPDFNIFWSEYIKTRSIQFPVWHPVLLSFVQKIIYVWFRVIIEIYVLFFCKRGHWLRYWVNLVTSVICYNLRHLCVRIKTSQTSPLCYSFIKFITNNTLRA